MKKNSPNKMMKEKPEGAPTGEKLVCLMRTEAPGFGAWKSGDEITDPVLVKRFRTNPNFKIVTTKEDK